MRQPATCLTRLAFLSVLIAPAVAGADDGAEFFEKTIRPILVDRCLDCHGPEKAKAGLRLDSREAVLRGGDSGPGVDLEQHEDGTILAAIRFQDEPKMPPKGALPASELEALTRWIAMGVPWGTQVDSPKPAAGPAGFRITPEQREFWAFRPIGNASVPSVKDSAWPRSDLDRFIVARLESEGLEPASTADRRTWIRRVTFDLTGLPPRPEDTAAFLADESSEAFERVADRLLASPAHGERWARHWLDVVRYADSLDTRGSGQPGDILDAWRYRDWVVRALNEDLPYDRFVRMQIAGDLLTPDDPAAEGFSRDGTIATTMLAIGNFGNGDADKDKILTDIADDQVDVVSKAFLGLTVSCARCHDHKFDPISQKDYYALAGIFFSTHILPELTPKGAGETIIRVPLASAAELARRKQRDESIASLELSIATRVKAMATAFAREQRGETTRYLMALREFDEGRMAGRATGMDEFAVERELRPSALRRWSDMVGQGGYQPMTTPVREILGVVGVDAWKGAADTPSASVNRNGEERRLLTFVLPPRSISVHPGPRSGVAVTWRSPISGRVKIDGRVSDSDPAGGDGVAWILDHRNAGGPRALASGDVPNGGDQDLRAGKVAASLDDVTVRAGDALQLLILPKGSHTCDTTTVVLTIVAEDGTRWDLSEDLVDEFLAANPHADRRGHEAVWRLDDMAGSSRSLSTDDREAAAFDAWRDAVDSGDQDALRRAAEVVQQAFQRDDASSPFWVDDPGDVTSIPEADRIALRSLREELTALKKAVPPPLEFANAAQDGGVPKSPHDGFHDVKIHLRGRYDRLGELAPRGYPEILALDGAASIRAGSGRKELADWLTRADHPLTARVIVNRIWQHHFGEGLVRTANNFGQLGDRPSHPELLDFLARRFMDEGWSMKRLHREIVLSSTYRQSSVPNPATLAADPENRLLGRMPRRRLEAEALRDHWLFASGTLDETRGGPAIRDFALPRRGLYVITIRSDRATYGALFDQADPTAPAEKRIASTVAPQALFLMNNPFAIAQAETLGKRLIREGADDRSRIVWAYDLLYARSATDDEIRAGLGLLDAFRPEGDEVAWRRYAQILLCTNEFLYID